MRISKDEVKHIANLSKLNFTDNELEKLVVQLENIVEFAEQLNEVNVEDIKPTAHIIDKSNIFRKDEIHESFERAEMLRNAPSKDCGCISVPKVVAEEE